MDSIHRRSRQSQQSEPVEPVASLHVRGGRLGGRGSWHSIAGAEAGCGRADGREAGGLNRTAISSGLACIHEPWSIGDIFRLEPSMVDFVIGLLIRTYLPRDEICMPRLAATCRAAAFTFRPIRTTAAIRLYDRRARILDRWRIFIYLLRDALEPPDTAHHWRRIVVLYLLGESDHDES